MRGKIVRIIPACELSEPILHCIFINSRELCPEQLCKLSGAWELARVKLSGYKAVMNFIPLNSIDVKCTRVRDLMTKSYVYKKY